jgi:hypothetical protein
MTEEEPPRPNGLPMNASAPLFNTKDIDGNRVSLEELLEIYNGILIDFFRGNW